MVVQVTTESRLEAVERRLDALTTLLASVQTDLAAVRQTLASVAPVAATPTAGTAARTRFYCVLVGRPVGVLGERLIPAGVPGLYNRYSSYANQVVTGATYPHEGRGRLQFAPETESQGFATVREAEAFWREHYGDDEPAPRFW